MLELERTPIIIWLCLIFTGLCFRATAQSTLGTIKAIEPKERKLISNPISGRFSIAGSDSLSLTNLAIGVRDSVRKDTLKKGDLETTVVYTAKDSTIMDVEAKEVHLYGGAEVTYGKIKLTANYIRINWTLNELYAKGTYDSTSNKVEGDPIFQDGSEEPYTTKEMRYNFKTRKGIIYGVVTQQGEGIIHGTKVKRDADGNAYMMGNMYTTCNLEHPHFFINARKIKMVKDKQIISGLFNLVINDVPLPLGLPFGFFPLPKNKEIGTSGIIFPQYGEEPNGRGFFLRNGGYYFAISQFVNAAVTGQIYSSGSWGLAVASTYISRYKYSGNLSLAFNRNRSGDEIEKKYGRDGRNDFSIQWSHTPKSRGTSSFSANVNVTSNSYNSFNSTDVQRYISNVATSSVQYSKTVNQYINGSASLRVNQNFGQINPATGRKSGGVTDVSTNFNLGLSQIAPFALKGASGRWYESFRVGASVAGTYGLTNVLTQIDTSANRLGYHIRYNGQRINDSIDALRAVGSVNLPVNGEYLNTLLKEGNFTGNYSIPISLPNFRILKHINFTPGISFSGQLFTKEYRYQYNADSNYVEVKMQNKIGTEYIYSFSGGLNTRVYGMFHPGIGRITDVRHTVVPTISFSYTPDFSGISYGFYQRTQINEKGDYRNLSRYRGFNTVGNGKASGVVSFGLANVLEMKLKSKSDTAETKYEKVMLLDNFGFNGSYDLIADSLKMSMISFSANTTIARKLTFNVGMSFDPYIYIPDPKFPSNGGVRVNRFAINNGQGLARLQNLNIALGTNFAPPGKKKNTEANRQKTGASEEVLEHIDRNPQMYVDFEMPWTLRVAYNFGWSKTGLLKPTMVQALTVSGDLSLTKKWKISANSGFDFAAKKPSITSLNIHRDLHCWDMTLSWTPYAGSSIRASNYNFTLRARSSILQDLKLTRQRSFYGY